MGGFIGVSEGPDGDVVQAAMVKEIPFYELLATIVADAENHVPPAQRPYGHWITVAILDLNRRLERLEREKR